MEDVEELRAQADRAQRLALAMTNDAERARLLTIAADLYRECDRLEAARRDAHPG